ncbi:MAG: hypothetical protein K0U44_00670, partial [Actinomycetia bacterium]|nr:hypothetical protein [Actinomycetes bacterium]
MEQYCRKLLISNSSAIRRVIAATIASALLLPAGLVSLITAPSASAAEAEEAVIEAIMGGGTVIGTACVDGKVEELVGDAAITNFGPDTTLYVKPSGKTRLRKDSGYSWVNGTGDSNKDQVKFVSKATGGSEGVSHYLSQETAVNEVAEFGTASGGTASVIQGQGTHEMRFQSQTKGTVTLGTMYTAKFNDADSSYSCTAPGAKAPQAPVIKTVTPMKDEKRYGVEIVLEPDVSQSIDRYNVQTTIGMNSNIWLPDEFPEAY